MLRVATQSKTDPEGAHAIRGTAKIDTGGRTPLAALPINWRKRENRELRKTEGALIEPLPTGAVRGILPAK